MEPQLAELLPKFAAVAKWPQVAAAVCGAAADERWAGPASAGAICSAAHLPLTRQGTVAAILEAGEPRGLFRRHSGVIWSPLADKVAMQHVAWMLQGVSIYLESIHRDSDEVEVVMTRPLRPSELERALREAGYEQIGLVATGEMFPAMAAAASAQFCIMTPFLDIAGAEALVHLFSRCAHSVERQLILRSSLTGLPEGYLAAADTFRQLRVKVFDYRRERDGGGFETFHAKVVMADRNWAYVGSTNMNQWSLSYSMELGVSLKGRAAGRIARVIDAVMRIATRVD